jgi:hypothetical protein
MAYNDTDLTPQETEMKNKIKSIANKTIGHLERQKWAYLWASFAVAGVALNRRNLKDFEKFLASKGIDKMEYYMSDLMAEMNQ